MALNLTMWMRGYLGIQVSVRACFVNSWTSVQETHFTSAADYRVLEDDYVVLSTYSSRSSVGSSLLIGRSLNAHVNLMIADDRGQLVVADAAVKSFEFRVIEVYASNIAAEKVSFFVAVSAVPRRSETDSFSGWLECDPWSQDKQDREGS